MNLFVRTGRLFSQKSKVVMPKRVQGSGMILDYNQFKEGLIPSIIGKVKTNFVLNHLSITFKDYNKSQYAKLSIKKYNELVDVFAKKDKSNLLYYVTPQLADLFRRRFKDEIQVPFVLDSAVMECKIVQARIIKENAKGKKGWVQITGQYLQQNKKVKYLIMERREGDIEADSWVFCHLD